MELKLITPQKTTLFHVAWVELNTPVGNFVIQTEHAPMIVTLVPDKPVLFKLLSGKEESVMIRQGIAHIQRQEMIIVMN